MAPAAYAPRPVSRRTLRVLASLSVALVVGALAIGGWLWRAGAQRAEGWLAADGDPTHAIAVEHGAPRRLDAPRDAELAMLTSPDDARDGAMLTDGRLVVATAGGALLYMGGAPDTRAPRLLTQLDGIAGVDLTAAARFGEGVLLADAGGQLTVLDGERATPLHLALARPAPVTSIAVAGDTAFLLVTGVGVLAFDGREARDIGASAHVDLRTATAMCVGARGLTVGTSEGALWIERARPGGRVELAEVSAGITGPITALACPGADTPALLVGTPFGLFRLDGDHASSFAPDRHVTSLLATAGGLFVGSFDAGVELLDGASGHARARHLTGERVSRLALLGDRVTAFTAHGVATFTGGTFTRLAPPSRGLASPTVTALAALSPGRIAVGEFAGGVDLVAGAAGELTVLRHLPGPADGDARDAQVNALVIRPSTHELLAATVRGVLHVAESGTARLPLGDLDAGIDGVAAIASLPSPAGALALATARGLVLTDGVHARLVYAFHGLANNHVYAIATRGDRVLAGTLGGLSLVALDGDRPRVVDSLRAGPRALHSAWVTALADSSEGTYVGTYGGGVQLARILSDKISIEELATPLAVHVNPGALTLDGDTLWVGTLESGLLAFDRTRHTFRRVEGVLPAADAGPILVDGDTLYIGCASGVVRASRHALESRLGPLHKTASAPGGSS